MKITMKSLADMLGVSRTTVSLVLRGKGSIARISPETSKRVLAKAEELNFTPNYFATALNNGETGTIGVVFPDVFEEYMSAMVKGMEDVFYTEGQILMLSTSRFDNLREQKIIRQMLHRGVDGIILAPSAPFKGTAFDYSHIDEIIAAGVPLIMIDRYIPGTPACRVVQDDEKMACRAVSTLCSKGYRRIACLSFDLDISSLTDRIAGYARALKEYPKTCRERQPGVKEDYWQLCTQNSRSTDLADMLDARLEAGTLPECFFVTTSGIAVRLAELLAERGLKAGIDIQICRFSAFKGDKIETNPFIEIPQPTYLLGRTAAEEMIKRISRPPEESRKHENTPKTIIVAAEEETEQKPEEQI
jgi:LacI family transcriptional regulator